MLLFSLKKFNYLARRLPLSAKLKQKNFDARRFSNGEWILTLKNNAAGQNCLILGTFAPPDENLLNMLLLGHTLKKNRARAVTAIVPYLGYGRQDKAEKNESLGLAWVGDFLTASGIDKIITVDLHNTASAPLLKTPVISLKSAALFAAALKKDGVKFDSILAPDKGARERCEELKQAAKTALPVAYCEKTRGPAGVFVSGIAGQLTGPRILIYDDILDTGETLIAACRAARRLGVREITVAVTHGLFTGKKWHELWKLGVKKIYTTDSMPQVFAKRDKKIKIIPVLPLLIKYLKPQK